MTVYVGKAGLTLVRRAGGYQYVYAGTPAPGDALPGELERLQAEGYLDVLEPVVVEVVVDVEDEGDDLGDFPEGDPDESWKVPQLKAYAKSYGVDLGDSTLKADIFTKVTA